MKKSLKEIDENPLLDGVTLSGGEPMLQVEALIELSKEGKEKAFTCHDLYSGYTFEQIRLGDVSRKRLLALCDTLVDGKFILSLKSMELLYKGSSMVIEQEINEYGEFVF